MRVVFDTTLQSSYMMETLHPQIIDPMPNSDHESQQLSIPSIPLHTDNLDDPERPSSSQRNLDVLITAINSKPPNSGHNINSHPSDHLARMANSNSNTAMSISSLLAGSDNTAVQHSPQQQQHPTWTVAQSSTPYLPSTVSLSKSKRKYEGTDDQPDRAKIRRTVHEHLVLDSSRIMSMTTVVCLHAAVAQKSYGSEKRFLCPPPIVRIEGPDASMRSQQLSMCIVSEDGIRSAPQKSTLDTNLQAAFKHLHVAGTAKQKNFHLALDLCTPPSTPPVGTPESAPRTWASFESAPVTIISKPSKKTAKTRNISSCILPGGPVSLFNRINSQTVRTKYMTIEHASLCASNVSWSAFNVNVLHRPPEPASNLTGPQPVTYGSQIVLTDTLSGIATGSLIIRKVDKGRVSLEDGGPVSQMQKIALQRVAPDGTRQYLSAASPSTTVGGVVVPQTPGPSNQSGTHTLTFQSPRIRDDVKDGVRFITDEVDDYLCWTIVGISKFQYTFFDALGKNHGPPKIPLTPFPTLFTPPGYRPNTNTLELTVSNFYGPSSDGQGLQPLEVWLGSIGPLKQRVFQATAPGPLTSVSSFGHGGNHSPVHHLGNGERISHSPEQHTPVAQVAASPPTASTDREVQSPTTNHSSPTPPRQASLGTLHSMVVLEMPPIEQIVETLHEISPRSHPINNIKGKGVKQERNGDDSEEEVLQAIDQPLSARTPPSHNSPSTAHPNNNNNGHSHSLIESSKRPIDPTAINGRSLPLLFVRSSDGMGYHSGRSVILENLIQNLTMNAMTNATGGPNVDPSWIAAAQQAAAADTGYATAWNLRVM